MRGRGVERLIFFFHLVYFHTVSHQLAKCFIQINISCTSCIRRSSILSAIYVHVPLLRCVHVYLNVKISRQQ